MIEVSLSFFEKGTKLERSRRNSLGSVSYYFLLLIAYSFIPLCERCSRGATDNPCVWIFYRTGYTYALATSRSPPEGVSSRSRSMCNVSRICNRWTARRSWRDCGPSSSLKQMTKGNGRLTRLTRVAGNPWCPSAGSKSSFSFVSFRFYFILSFSFFLFFTLKEFHERTGMFATRKEDAFVKDSTNSKGDRGGERERESKKYQPSLIHSSLLFPIKWTSLCYLPDNEYISQLIRLIGELERGSD